MTTDNKDDEHVTAEQLLHMRLTCLADTLHAARRNVVVNVDEDLGARPYYRRDTHEIVLLSDTCLDLGWKQQDAAVECWNISGRLETVRMSNLARVPFTDLGIRQLRETVFGREPYEMEAVPRVGSWKE
jgi:hypothetical protein